jgi:hypothetical protein
LLKLLVPKETVGTQDNPHNTKDDPSATTTISSGDSRINIKQAELQKTELQFQQRYHQNLEVQYRYSFLSIGSTAFLHSNRAQRPHPVRNLLVHHLDAIPPATPEPLSPVLASRNSVLR